jgi:glutamate synthase (NADPH/NADH) small chain
MSGRRCFLKFKRLNPGKIAPSDRIRNFSEFEIPLSDTLLRNQAARCLDCGIPFCHSTGCPLDNRIPDWNRMVARSDWQKALTLLHSTNNFPEFTGRICPAPCEYACTLAIHDAPVTIRHIELQIVEKGWREGWNRAPSGKQ